MYKNEQAIPEEAAKGRGKPEYTAAANLQLVIRQYVRSRNLLKELVSKNSAITS